VILLAFLAKAQPEPGLSAWIAAARADIGSADGREHRRVVIAHIRIHSRELPLHLSRLVEYRPVVFGANLRLPDPRIAGRGKAGNRVFGQGGWIQRGKYGPVLSTFEREAPPIHPAVGEAQANEIHIDAVCEGSFAAKKIDFRLAADFGARDFRPLELHADAAL